MTLFNNDLVVAVRRYSEWSSMKGYVNLMFLANDKVDKCLHPQVDYKRSLSKQGLNYIHIVLELHAIITAKLKQLQTEEK